MNIILEILLAILASTGIYFFFRYIEEWRKKRLQYALLAFQSHTNPHFIKNVMQAINWFILNNEKKLASDYLCDFSILMENILIFSKRNFITLSEKLEFLDLYIKLQHLRHKDKFDYIPLQSDGVTPTIQVAKNINPEVFLLPPLLIHPFIENAIEHGLKPKQSKGMLRIVFSFKLNYLECVICDNGIGIKASKKLHTDFNIRRSMVGIINTRKRIEIVRKLYGIKIKYTIKELNPEETEPGTIVTLYFPMPLNFNPQTGFPKEIY
jgi:two-component system LytT family sensor kinase